MSQVSNSNQKHFYYNRTTKISSTTTTTTNRTTAQHVSAQPSIKKLLENELEAKLGEKVVLNLHALAGTPPNLDAEIEWFHNEMQIEYNERIYLVKEKIEETTFISYSLVIETCDYKDSGEYKACLKNEYGQIIDTTKSYLNVLLLVNKNSPPRFVEHLQEIISVNEGEEVRFQCKCAFASPEPQIKWFKDGVLIEKSNRIKVIVCFFFENFVY